MPTIVSRPRAAALLALVLLGCQGGATAPERTHDPAGAPEGTAQSTEPQVTPGVVEWVITDVATTKADPGWRLAAVTTALHNGTPTWHMWDPYVRRFGPGVPNSISIAEGRTYEATFSHWQQAVDTALGIIPQTGQNALNTTPMTPIPPGASWCGTFSDLNFNASFGSFGVLGLIPTDTSVTSIGTEDGTEVAVKSGASCSAPDASARIDESVDLSTVGPGRVSVTDYRSGKKPSITVTVKNDAELDGLAVCVRAWLVTSKGLYAPGSNEGAGWLGSCGRSSDYVAPIGPDQRKRYDFEFPEVHKRAGEPSVVIVEVCRVQEVRVGDLSNNGTAAEDCNLGVGDFLMAELS